jgi:phosphoribosylformylglycinamidine cyclo-ligase
MCHVTGGGLLNFLRLSKFGFRFDNPLTPPEIFRWIQETGKISPIEMYRTFNMGMGYAYVVPPESVDAVTKLVDGARVVGEVIEKPGAWLGDVQVS